MQADYPPLILYRDFSCTADILFDAWTKPDLLRKWLFVGPTSSIVHIDSDLSVHGIFSIIEREEKTGEYIDHYGNYLIIDKPERLEFTLSAPAHFPGETRVQVDIEMDDAVCTMKLKQTGVDPAITRKNWEMMLQNLKLLVENQ